MMSELKLALWLCFTCISVKDLHPFQSFYKPLSPYSVHPKTVERDCERQVNRDKDGDSGGQRPQTYEERTNRSCDETQIRVFSHIKRHLKSHSKPVMEKKMTCFLSPKTVYNKERKTQEETEKKCSVQPNDISFNIVAHSGLKEAFSGHCYDRFQLGLSSQLYLFFYTLTVFICFRVPTCTP